MTVAMLMENTVNCAEKQNTVSNSWNLSYLSLRRVNPVPRLVILLFKDSLADKLTNS